MKILLVEPPRVLTNANIRILGSVGQYKGEYCWPPLDLTIIAGLLRKHGLDADIRDYNATRGTFEDLRKEMQDMHPDVVIFTTSTSTISSDLNVANIVKDVSPKTVTVAIGTHVAAKPDETMGACQHLDMIILNPEPEMSVLGLIKGNLKPGKVEGLCYRSDKKLVKSPYKKIVNLDEFGTPAHDKIDANLYSDPLMVRRPMALTYASRGCRWGKCIYCCNPYFYGPMRFRSIPNVIEELKWLVKLGIKEIKWFDPEFNNNIKYTEELCDRIIKEGIDITWAADMRVDIMPIELLEKMKKAGCHTILIGVESGDPEILNTIKKGITLDMVREAVKKIRKVGMNVITHFLVGLPGDTEESMRKTLNFAKELNPDATTFGIVVPHPGTEFTDIIEQGGCFITRDYNKYDTSSPPVYDYPNLSSQEIYEFMRYAYRSFYFRPTYILRKFLKVRSMTELRNGVANFRNLISRLA